MTEAPNTTAVASDLGRLLDVLSGSRPEDIHSLRARSFFAPGGMDGDGGITEESQLWWRAPDCYRHESNSKITVHRGSHRWEYEPATRSGSVVELPGYTPDWIIGHHFDRRILTGDLEVLGDVVVGGRDAIAVRVTVPEGVHDFGIGSMGLSPGYDIELAIDVATGMILRQYDPDGLVTELHDVAVNEVVPDELFQSPIEPGSAVRVGGNVQQDFFTDMAELLVEFDGPLLVPSLLPEGSLPSWLSRSTFTDGLILTMRYHLWPGRDTHLSIEQGTSGASHWLRFQPVEGTVVEEVDGVEVQLELRGSSTFARRHDLVHPVVVNGTGAHGRAVAAAVAANLVEVNW